MITAELNAKAVIANIPQLSRTIDNSAMAGNYGAAYELMRLSQFEVPHDEGTLQNSGTVESMPNGDVIVGYHTVYAARLHEHPEYHFGKGRKGKYLEDPILRNLDTLGMKFNKQAQTRLF